jgi:hypothetical protein
MKLPRNISGTEWVKRPGRLGYDITRQTGSHIRLTCETPLNITSRFPITTHSVSARLPGYLSALAEHHQLTREQLVKTLFDDKR